MGFDTLSTRCVFGYYTEPHSHISAQLKVPPLRTPCSTFKVWQRSFSTWDRLTDLCFSVCGPQGADLYRTIRCPEGENPGEPSDREAGSRDDALSFHLNEFTPVVCTHQPEDMFVCDEEERDISCPPAWKRLKKSQCTPLFMNAYTMRGESLERARMHTANYLFNGVNVCFCWSGFYQHTLSTLRNREEYF